jgi:hypothetical protein
MTKGPNTRRNWVITCKSNNTREEKIQCPMSELAPQALWFSEWTQLTRLERREFKNSFASYMNDKNVKAKAKEENRKVTQAKKKKRERKEKDAKQREKRRMKEKAKKAKANKSKGHYKKK